MTEERFKELFEEKEELYIKISDLKKILVSEDSGELVYDYLIKYKSKIWGSKTKTFSTTLYALRRVFGNGWETTLRFPRLGRDFKKLTYLGGVGKTTLGKIVMLYKLGGNKLTSEMLKYQELC